MPDFKHRWRFAMIQFAWLSALMLTVYMTDFTVSNMALAGAIGFVTVIVTTVLFDWSRIQQEWQTNTRKQKRKPKHTALDTLLRNLSDDELETLHQRLRDNAQDDERQQERVISADGELVQRR